MIIHDYLQWVVPGHSLASQRYRDLSKSCKRRSVDPLSMTLCYNMNSLCVLDKISGTLHHAVEVGAEILKFIVPGLAPHLEAGQLGQHDDAVKMTNINESPH